MTRDTTPKGPAAAKVRAAKGAAREAIGKLIGDDAEVRKGRIEQADATGAAASDPDHPTHQQE